MMDKTTFQTAFQGTLKDWKIVEYLGEGAQGAGYLASRVTAAGYTEWASIRYISVPKDREELEDVYNLLGTRDYQAVMEELEKKAGEIKDQYAKGHFGEIVEKQPTVLSTQKKDSQGFDLLIFAVLKNGYFSGGELKDAEREQMLKACDPQVREAAAAPQTGSKRVARELTVEEKRRLQKWEEEEARKKAEQERKQKEEEERKAQEKKKKKSLTFAIAAVALLILGVVFFFVSNNVRQDNQYKAAVEAYNGKDREKALDMFTALNGYKDSRDYIQKINDEKAREESYARAMTAFENKEYARAKEIFEELAAVPYSDAAEKASLMQQYLNYEEARELLSSSLYEDYVKAVGILEALGDDFEDAKSLRLAAKAAIQMEDDYTKALEFEQSREYENALKAYKALSTLNAGQGYRDSIQRAAEMQKYVDYDLALTYYQDGDYGKALELFSALGDFKTAATYASRAADAIEEASNKAAYEEALRLESQEQYQQALEIYQTIPEYSDATDRAAKMQNYLLYREAEAEAKQENYEEAIRIFTALSNENFRDAGYQLSQVQQLKAQEEAYQAALSLEANQSYPEALKAFNALYAYKDSSKHAQNLEHLLDYRAAEEKLAKEDFEGAIEAFEALGDYSDAAARKEEAIQRRSTEEAYQAALKLEASGQYRDAYFAFAALGEYKSAAAKREEMLQYIDYQVDENGEIISRESIVGENLLQDSARIRVSSGGLIEIPVKDILQGYEGFPVSISFDAKSLGADSHAISVYAYQESGMSIRDTREFTLSSSDYTRYKFTSTVYNYKYQVDPNTGEGCSAGSIAFQNTGDAKGEFCIRNIKIEIDSQPTEWSFAPNDPILTGENLLPGGAQTRKASQETGFAVDVDVYEQLKDQVGQLITVSFDALSSDGSACEIIAAPGQYSGITIEKETRFEVSGSRFTRLAFTTWVTNFGVQTDSNGIALSPGKITFSSANGKPFEIRQVKMEVGHTASAYTFAPGESLVTGENLLPDSSRELFSSGDGNLQIPVRSLLEGKNGLPLCISFEARTADRSARQLRVSALQGSGLSMDGEYFFDLSGRDYRRCEIITSVRDFGLLTESDGSLAFTDQSQEKGAFVVRNIKIEIGQKPTAWSAAPSDPAGTGENLLSTGYRETVSSNGYYGIPVKSDLEGHVGRQVCVSFEARSSRGEHPIKVYAFQNSGISIEDRVDIVIGGDYQWYSFVTYVYDYGVQTDPLTGGTLSEGEISFYDPADNKSDFSIRRVKIELGSERTEWRYGARTPELNGENLLPGYAMEMSSTDGFAKADVGDALRAYAGVPVCISFEAKMQGPEEGKIQVYPYQNSGVSMDLEAVLPFTVAADQFRTYSFNTILRDYGLQQAQDGSELTRGSLAFSCAVGHDFIIRKVKVEYGTKPTTFSFAANDPLNSHENLLLDSARIRHTDAGFLSLDTYDLLKDYDALPVTISFDARCEGTGEQTLQVYGYQSSGVSISKKAEFTLLPGVYQRFVFSTKVQHFPFRTDPDSGESYTRGAIAFFDPADAKQPFSIRNIKIELGSQATDWSYAPNDPTVTGDNLLSGCSQTVSSGSGFAAIPVREALKDVIGHPVTVSFQARSHNPEGCAVQIYAFQYSGISVADAAEMTFTPQYADYSYTTWAVDFGILTGENGEAYSDGSIAFHSTAGGDFDLRRMKIEVGTRPSGFTFAKQDPILSHQNLLTDSARERVSENGFLSVGVMEALKGYDGLPVTLSFEIRGEGYGEQTIQVYPYQGSGISISGTAELTFSGEEYQRYALNTQVADYGVLSDPNTGETYSTGAIAFFDPSESKRNFAIRNIKIEVGDQATDWSPAENEDLQAAEDAPAETAALEPQPSAETAASESPAQTESDPSVVNVNLLKDSARVRTSNAGFISVDVYEALRDHLEQPVTVSFEAMGSGDQTIQVYAFQGSGVSIADGAEFAIHADGYRKYELHTRAHDYTVLSDPNTGETYSKGAIAFYDPAGNKQDFTVRNIKIELGDRATAWCFAPDDPVVTGRNLFTSGARKRSSNRGFIEVVVRNALKDSIGQPVVISFRARSKEAESCKLQVYGYQYSGISVTDSAEFTLSREEKDYSFATWVTDFGIKTDDRGRKLSRGSLAFFNPEGQKFEISGIDIRVGTLTGQ